MRAFIAIEVPDYIKEKLVELQKELEGNCIKKVPPENMHITLNFLGEKTAEEVESITEKLRSMRVKTNKITVGGTGAFPSKHYIRVVWVGARGCENIAEKTCFTGECVKHGHITIARVKCRVDLEGFFKKHTEELGSFVPREMVVYESILKRPNPEYIEVARIGLVQE